MSGINGIPQAFSPTQLRREFNDFKREVEQKLSARKYVSLERITVAEGGKIDQAVGTQLTETVQKEIVVERHNLAEAALTDVVVTGSIATTGKTAEDPPRDIRVMLTTITRDTLSGGTYSNPGLVFDDGTNIQGLNRAPGMYSPDGKSLVITGRDGINGQGTLELSRQVAALVADRLILGDRGFWPTEQVDILANDIRIGDQGRTDMLPIPAAKVHLMGEVKVNGARVMKTITPGIPTSEQPVHLIASGEATTDSLGRFTITFPTNAFPNACQQIFIVPDSGGGTIPVVDGPGSLTRHGCKAVQPGNGNKSITYSYQAFGY